MNDQQESAVNTPIPSAADPLSVAIAQQQALAQGEFKLLRAYLIDSLAPGRRVCFELDGGAVLTGVNGRGKTSLLQLLLLFNGTNPNQLVSKGKSSFIEYYLPNNTSYIVFEYQVEDGSKRMVIAYSNSTGDKVFYRFVRQGYDKAIFVDEDKRFITNGDLRKRLTNLKIVHSPHQIETYTDYRAVIQYNVPQTVDRKHRDKIKDLCADYAFTRYNKPLTNMDRLGFGMFSQTSNFDVLKSIVIESIFDNQTSHRVGTQRSAIESWPSKYKAYLEVMEAQDKYEEAKDKLLLCDADIASLSEIREQVALLLDDMTIKEVQTQASLDQAKHSLAEEVSSYNDSHMQLESRRVQHVMRIEQHTRDIAAIDADKAQYDSLDIHTKQIEYASRANVAGQLNSLKARKDAMTASHTPIVSRFEMIKAEIISRFSTAQRLHMAAVDECREASQVKLDAITANNRAVEEQHQAQYLSKRSALMNEIQALFQQLGACQQNLSNPQVPESIVQLLARADDTLTTTRVAYEKLREILIGAEQELAKAKKATEAAQDKVSRGAEEIVRQREKVDQIIKDNTPAKDSLLHALRETKPDWNTDIARVIRTDILHRNDLSPAFFEGTGIYGLELALDNLDACPESDPHYLQQMVEDEQRKLDKMVSSQKELEATLKSLERVENEKAQEVSGLKRESINSKSQLQQAEAAKEKAKFEFQKAQKHAKDIAQSAADDVEQKLKSAQALQEDFETKSTQDLNARKMAYAKQEQTAKDERNEEIARLEREFKSKELQREVDLANCQRECNEALQEKGIDAQSLKALDDQILECEQKLEYIDSLKPLLGKWVNWHREVYIKRDSLANLMELEIESNEEVVASQAALKQKHDARKTELGETITQSEDALKNLAALKTRGALMGDRLAQYVLPSRHQHVDPSWSIDGLSQLMASVLESLEANNKGLDKMVSSLKRKFEKTVNSTVFETYEHYRQNHTMDNARDYMAFFETWYTQAHQSAFDTLRSVAVLFTQDIISFHDKLKTFSDKLNRFNRDLQNHLSGCNDYFREIQDLSVHIYSAVDELKSWGTIKSIVENRGDWINGQDRLPDGKFVSDVEMLLEQWDIKNGITAEFIHLISIRGQVTENGNVRKFKRSEDLKGVSSNGLSYLILILLFVAFWNKIKKDSPVNLLWALDELKVISENNIESLMRLLRDNRITLVSAFPDPDVNTLRLFKNAYTVDQDRRLVSTRIASAQENRHV